MCEELGLIIAICAVLAILALALFFSPCATPATAARLLFDSRLRNGEHVYGSGRAQRVPVLWIYSPFTGTVPFVSRGGTSVLACWMLLAFIKAGDTRKGASFVVRPPRQKTKKQRESAEERKETA